MNETIPKNANLSAYQPTSEIVNFTANVKRDYQRGVDILNKPYLELNNRSLLDDQNRGQLMFNAFVDTSVEDPNEAWKWRGTRSMARNKGIAMHAQLAANYLLCSFTAQDENDEVDKIFSEGIEDIIEWMAMPTNSNYQSSFFQMVFAMITNPITYMGVEYCEVMQTIRERQADGTITKKEVLDEILSGFQAPIYSVDQVLILNAYERNLQKQRRIIKRRFVEKSELDAKYKDHPYWSFVTEGTRSIYNDSDHLFYEVKDDEHPYLVTEETVLSRRDDSEVCFVNGIYLGDVDSIEDNPIKHRDNRGAPKYNVVPFGFHRIGEHFFAYKSMMNAMGWDNDLYDAMSEVVMNRAMLELEMPLAISGTDQIDSEVIFPNSVLTLENPESKVTPLIPGSNMVGGFNALRETEKSLNDGSLNETLSGQLPDASQKAFNVAQAQVNAKKLIGPVAKSLAESAVNYGDLMKDIVVNHIMAPEVQELTSGQLKLKYRSFYLPNKSSKGRSVDKKIKLETDLIGAVMTPEEKDYGEAKLLEDSGYPDSKNSLVLLNPELAAKFKYLTKAEAEELFDKSKEYWQPVLLNLKAALALDPYTDQEALTRKLMNAYFNSEGDDMVKKPAAVPPPTAPAPMGNIPTPFTQTKLSPNAPSVLP